MVLADVALHRANEDVLADGTGHQRLVQMLFIHYIHYLDSHFMMIA
jgi:hypothetical protein